MQIWNAIAAVPAYKEVIPSKTWLKRKLVNQMAANKNLLRTSAKLRVTGRQRRAGEGAAKYQAHPKLLVSHDERGRRLRSSSSSSPWCAGGRCPGRRLCQ